MRAITARDRAAGAAGLRLSDIPRPQAAENDVIVAVHAAGFTPGELAWPAPGPIGPATTGLAACLDTSYQVSSPNWATAPPG